MSKTTVPCGPYLPPQQLERQEFKKFYKATRLEDGKTVGRRINAVMQGLHLQYKAPKDKRDANLIKACLEEITEIRKESRFRDDFPSFAKFMKFVRKTKLTLKDLKDVTGAT